MRAHSTGRHQPWRAIARLGREAGGLRCSEQHAELQRRYGSMLSAGGVEAGSGQHIERPRLFGHGEFAILHFLEADLVALLRLLRFCASRSLAPLEQLRSVITGYVEGRLGRVRGLIRSIHSCPPDTLPYRHRHQSPAQPPHPAIPPEPPKPPQSAPARANQPPPLKKRPPEATLSSISSQTLFACARLTGFTRNAWHYNIIPGLVRSERRVSGCATPLPRGRGSDWSARKRAGVDMGVDAARKCFLLRSAPQKIVMKIGSDCCDRQGCRRHWIWRGRKSV